MPPGQQPAPASALANTALALIMTELNQKSGGIARFRRLDVDGSGELAVAEFKKCIHAMGVHLSAPQLGALVELLGSGGRISIQKFVDRAFVAKIEQARRAVKAASFTGTGGADFVDLFASFDKDHSGALEFPEFLEMMRRSVRLPPDVVSDKELKQMCDYMDDDRNGQIECDEFVNFLNTEDLTSTDDSSATMKAAEYIRAHMQKSQFRQLDVFHRMDADGSGELDEEELAAALAEMGLKITEAEVQLLMGAIDTDGGGTVDIDEFLTFLKKARQPTQARVPAKRPLSSPHERWGGPGPSPEEGGSTIDSRVTRGRGCDYAKRVVARFRKTAPNTAWSPTRPLPRRIAMPVLGSAMQPGPSPYTGGGSGSPRARQLRRKQPATARSAQQARSPRTPRSVRARMVRPSAPNALGSVASLEGGGSTAKVDPALAGAHGLLRRRVLQQELSEPTAQRRALSSLEEFERASLISPAEHKRIARAYKNPSPAMQNVAMNRDNLISGWRQQLHTNTERAASKRETQTDAVSRSHTRAVWPTELSVITAGCCAQVERLRHSIVNNRHVISSASLVMRPHTAGNERVQVSASAGGQSSPRQGLTPRPPGAGLESHGARLAALVAQLLARQSQSCCMRRCARRSLRPQLAADDSADGLRRIVGLRRPLGLPSWGCGVAAVVCRRHRHG